MNDTPVTSSEMASHDEHNRSG